jgi:hypothetical protein
LVGEEKSVLPYSTKSPRRNWFTIFDINVTIIGRERETSTAPVVGSLEMSKEIGKVLCRRRNPKNERLAFRDEGCVGVRG